MPPKRKKMSDWLSSALMNLMISSAVFVAGLYATQTRTVEQISTLSDNVSQMNVEMKDAIEKSEKRQTDAIKLLRNDFNDMRRDFYAPRIQK